ncbi:hypothetical protein [Flavobacterium aurantiibacter]|uniref:Tetratricopeptide repeat protein n=1 Tax=Flavobacterium aurantiibacter TaxID=2023067 RepID=A0A256AF90_9FLAO|nr:hypothetical protein [Flavobacterium aurantiibacter]OYQ51830.1 hypothetical protein CHX27_00130 [Flavobacterium aurantiibacter]
MNCKIYLLILLVTLSSSCQNKQPETKTVAKTDTKCLKLFQKYREKFVTSEKDSARDYIESAMKCAPENKNYINNAIQLYIKIGSYENAITQIEKLKSDGSDISLDFMISVLKLKMNVPSIDNDLRKIYGQYKNNKQLTSSNLIYKIALDNYFNDRNYALNQLKEYRKVYITEYDVQNLDAAESLVKSLGKKEVLFALFNIKD